MSSSSCQLVYSRLPFDVYETPRVRRSINYLHLRATAGADREKVKEIYRVPCALLRLDFEVLVRQRLVPGYAQLTAKQEEGLTEVHIYGVKCVRSKRMVAQSRVHTMLLN